MEFFLKKKKKPITFSSGGKKCKKKGERYKTETGCHFRQEIQSVARRWDEKSRGISRNGKVKPNILHYRAMETNKATK